jgi:hypothetical protein
MAQQMTFDQARNQAEDKLRREDWSQRLQEESR